MYLLKIKKGGNMMESRQEGKSGHFFNDRGILEVWYKGVCYGNCVPAEAVEEAAKKVEKEEK